MIVRRSLSWRQVGSYVGRPMLGFFAWAVLVSAAHYFKYNWLSFPSLPISLLAATLGILLGFRNNSGYDRWWEARTLWGGLVNQSRTFSRQVLTFLPAADRPAGDGAGPDRRGSAGVIARTRLTETALVGGEAADAQEARAGRNGGSDGRNGQVQGGGDAVPHRRYSDGAVRDREGHASLHALVSGHDPQLAAFRAAAAQVAERAAAEEEDDDRAGDGGLEPCHFDQVSAEARELVYAQVGYVNALRCHLRRQDPFPEIAPFFRPAVVEALRGEQNVPAAILVWMATRLRRLLDGRRPDDAFRLAALDDTLTELTNLMGACERIKNTPIPRQYDFLPRVMVRAYLVVLPLGMVRELALVTPLITAVIAFLFLSMDQIGRNVEAPFENDVHDTPMTALCRTIEINLRQMLGESELPPPAQPVNGFLY